jgi:UDP-glucose 4-epimerase
MSSPSRIVVTGGNGFIGRHLCRRLREAMPDLPLVVWGRRTPREALPQGCTFVSVDVSDPAAVRTGLAGRDLVFHLAAMASVPDLLRDPTLGHEVNVCGTFNVLDAARVVRVSKVILVSTIRVVGRATSPPVPETAPLMPAEPYGAQKAAGELYARVFADAFGVRVVIARPSNVYGPGRVMNPGSMSDVVARFATQTLEGQPVTVTGDGRQRLDLVYVDDVARGLVACADVELEPARVVHLASGVATSIAELVDAVGHAAGVEPRVVRVPANEDTLDSFPSLDRTRMELGYEPRFSLKAGLREYVDWLRRGIR